MDLMHEQTDKRLKTLEKRLKKEYTKALKELKEKAKNYFRAFELLDQKKKTDLRNNKISYAEYIDWRTNKMLTGLKYENMIQSLSKVLVSADIVSARLTSEQIPNVYIDNYNYSNVEIEKGIGAPIDFTMVNTDTLDSLLSHNGTKLLLPKVNVPKDYRWNMRKIRSALAQGVIMGESINKIAKRLDGVAKMGKTSAIRTARTAVTSTENMARIDGYEYAVSLGIHVKKKWVATHDGRTRDSHLLLDGEVQEIDEPFSNGLMYPADPNGAPSEVYNCRCTLIADFDEEELYGIHK